ncbi:hypothetical protein NL108_018388 [Boleophthalmus pectinirostris]|nr:hypothetical protein NL108_018388 [Boleophthalmus pectinirostris]
MIQIQKKCTTGQCGRNLHPTPPTSTQLHQTSTNLHPTPPTSTQTPPKNLHQPPPKPPPKPPPTPPKTPPTSKKPHPLHPKWVQKTPPNLTAGGSVVQLHQKQETLFSVT